jgi:hypothetical protein
MTLEQKIRNFEKRWNIPDDRRAEIEKFKRRVLLSFDEHMGDILSNSWVGIEYIRMLALPPAATADLDRRTRYETKARKEGGYKAEITFPFTPQKVEFHTTEIWDHINHITDLREIIRCIQYVFWLRDCFSSDAVKEWEDKYVKPFFTSIKHGIALSKIPVRVSGSSANLRDVIFYPRGAKLLDEALVNDNLNWLDEYSKKAKKFFESALIDFCDKHYLESINKMRMSLEAFLKKMLNKRKSLEKQIGELGRYLKTQNVPADIRNTYSSLLAQYINYQNTFAKHHDDFVASGRPTEEEAEFIIYQTGVLMRFLIQVDRNSQQTNAR